MGFVSVMEGVRPFGASCPNELPLAVAQTILEFFSDAVMRQMRQTG